MKLVLGIANFNKKYGFLNSINKKKINLILKTAYLLKFKEIDTANNYSQSNKILSSINYKKKFLINTKLPIIRGQNFKKKIDCEIKSFKKIMKITKINTLLFHDRNQIFEKNIKEIINYILELKKNKVIQNFGFSIYNQNELNTILKYTNPDTIQLPGNIFDQRYLNKKILKDLKSKKIEIQIRSIFLQGITLKQIFPFKDKNLVNILKNYWKRLDRLKISPLIYNVNFLKKFKNVNKFVVSFEDQIQMIEFFNYFNSKKKDINNGFKTNNLYLLNPYLWKKK